MEQTGPPPEQEKSTDVNAAIEALTRYFQKLQFPSQFGQTLDEQAEAAGRYYRLNVREVFDDETIRMAFFILDPPPEEFLAP